MAKNGKLSGYEVLERIKAGRTEIPENQRIKLLNYLYEREFQNAGRVSRKKYPPANGITDRRKRYAVEQVKNICEELGVDSAGIETAPSKVVCGILIGSGISELKK